MQEPTTVSVKLILVTVTLFSALPHLSVIVQVEIWFRNYMPGNQGVSFWILLSIAVRISGITPGKEGVGTDGVSFTVIGIRLVITVINGTVAMVIFCLCLQLSFSNAIQVSFTKFLCFFFYYIFELIQVVAHLLWKKFFVHPSVVWGAPWGLDVVEPSHNTNGFPKFVDIPNNENHTQNTKANVLQGKAGKC